NEGYACTISFQECIGSNRRAVPDFGLPAACNLLDGSEHGSRGIAWRGTHFQNFKAAVFQVDTIGKRAAGIDGNAHGRPEPILFSMLQVSVVEPGPLRWRSTTGAQRRTLLAAALGWMLDAFDVMLYALVLTYIMRDLGMSKAVAGSLGSLTLLASGIGGVAFGFLADRVGRKRALMLSILTYSICSFASGLSTSILMLAVFRFILGLGMGGEWNTGATLVAETWPTELRAKAIAIVQS